MEAFLALSWFTIVTVAMVLWVVYKHRNSK
jgi:hypothetical protein